MKPFRARKKTAAAYEVDIAEKFSETNGKIDGLAKEISSWRSTVDRQLTKLNQNMESVLKTIADHSARIAQLEQNQRDGQVRRRAFQDAAQTGWAVLKCLGCSIVVGGSIAGCGWALKALQILK